MNGHGHTTTPPPSTGGNKRQGGKNSCLLIGLGCLGLLLLLGLPGLGMLMWFKDDMADWVNETWSRRATPPTGGMGGSAVPIPAGSIPSPMRSVQYTGSPQGNRMSFEMQLYLKVLTTQATHPSDIQELSELEAKVVFADDGTSGTATVDLLSPDRSRKATMHMSFELDKVGRDWNFTLDKLDAP